MDIEKIKKAVRDILEALGEDPSREGLEDTPARVAEMYQEIFSGLRQEPKELFQTPFSEAYEGTVLLKDIPYYSVCEHHLLPFFGSAHIAYIPSGRLAGASKLARLVDIFARRPQLQERMTTQIADAIMASLKPQGVAVVVEGLHLCMIMRGVKKANARVVTSITRGSFKGNPHARSELMALLPKP